MKTASPIITVLMLSFIGCMQSTQTARQASESSATASPAANSSGAAVAKSSGERGTPAEARAMLQKAVDHYNSVGRKQAFADFNDKKAPFGDRDLYVACIGPDHLIVANGGFPSLVGTSADGWKDADGKPLGKQSWEIANSKGEGSIQYHWTNPVSHKMEPKILFFQKVGEDVCGVGAYNP